MREQEMKKILWLLGVCVLLLFAVTAYGGTGSAAPAGSIPVQITETDFHIVSSMTSFVPGRTYHFLVTNQGKVMHELMILPKAMGRMQGMSMADMDGSVRTQKSIWQGRHSWSMLVGNNYMMKDN